MNSRSKTGQPYARTKGVYEVWEGEGYDENDIKHSWLFGRYSTFKDAVKRTVREWCDDIMSEEGCMYVVAVITYRDATHPRRIIATLDDDSGIDYAEQDIDRSRSDIEFLLEREQGKKKGKYILDYKGNVIRRW